MEMGRNISFSVLSGLHPMEMKYLYPIVTKAIFILDKIVDKLSLIPVVKEDMIK